ncbi:MAG: flagellar motor switch protein FliG [Gammaproteobacteria bacterium]|nr:flagellar motor switch protein FliG [Gammaproteobacteria bacterium]
MSEPEQGKDLTPAGATDEDANNALVQSETGLSGTERAAVLLLTLGEEEAASVMKHMDHKEVQRIGMGMANLSNVTKIQVTQVVKEFYEIMQNATALGVDTDDYIRNVLVKALGEEKANNLLDRILLGGHIKGLEAFKWMDPRSIADVVRNEHPQIIAIVLSFLEPDQAADVLSVFSEPVRVDVILRIATLEGIQPSALQELNEIMETQFAGNANVQASSVGGVKTAANILNFMDSSAEAEILDSIKDVDVELAETIEDLMFVFDNLVDIDDRGIQTLLREIGTDDLVVALKGADEVIKDKIFKNMSKRAGDMLADDMEARGPVKVSDVETAQKNIVAIARRMAENGEINLQQNKDEYI